VSGGLSGKDVEDILRLLDATRFDEIELEMDGLSLHISRGAPPPAAASAKPPPLAGGGGAERRRGRRGVAPKESTASDAEESGALPVVAPHVGIFYRAPAPDGEPYVEVGSEVEEHTTVAIVEVMKLMDAVAAGVAGSVARICVDNGEAVEEGQTLILVRPRALPPSAPSGAPSHLPPRGGEV
jgi:acetyl-CoA carboxylase biotin carboxyl carrier protein